MDLNQAMIRMQKITETLGDLIGTAKVAETVKTYDDKVLKELALPNLITEEQIRRYILSVPWRQSVDKSHEYTLFKWVEGSWPYFAAFAQHIRNNGYAGYYFRTKYTVYDIDGKSYWTMGYPLVSERPDDQTILINRADNLPGDPHRNPEYPTQTTI